MSQILTKPVAQEQREQKLELHTPVKRIVGFTIVATGLAVVASLVATAHIFHPYQKR